MATSATLAERGPTPAFVALRVADIVRDLNRFLRGWSGYFRYGSSAQFFEKISLNADGEERR